MSCGFYFLDLQALMEIRVRWTLTLAGVSSLSELRGQVTDGAKDSPCIAGLRSVAWKVKAQLLPE